MATCTAASGARRFDKPPPRPPPTTPQNPAATDVTFTVEATSDLSNPLSWSRAGLIIESNTSTQLIVRDNVPSGPGVQRFMRVKVIRP